MNTHIGILFTARLLLTCVFSLISIAEADLPQKDGIAEVIEDLGSGDPQARTQAIDRLRGHPCAQVGPRLTALLERDPTFQEREVRRAGYEVLASCEGQYGDAVRDALLRGINDSDSSIVRNSARALSRAESSVKVEAARLFADRWEQWVQPGDDPGMWLIESMRDIEAIDMLIPKLIAADTPKSSETTLAVFAILGSKTDGLFDGDPLDQKAIRQFVVESFRSPERDVRKAAMQALMPVYGYDLMLFDSPTEYALNPEVEKVMREVASNDPEQEFRDKAARTLKYWEENLDEIAQKFLRKRTEKNKVDEHPPQPD